MAAEVQRIPTGIPGLDELIEGGVIKGRTLLISGASGTGKTTIALQFLHNCATKNIPAIHVALEEKPKNIRKDAARFNMNIEELEGRGLFSIISGAEALAGMPSTEKEKLHMGFDVQRLIQKIFEVSKKMRAEVVCIDSIPALQRYFDSDKDIRRTVLELSYILSEVGLTLVLITGAYESGGSSQFGIEDYIADGVFVLEYGAAGVFKGGKSARTFFIRKMRGTQHYEDYSVLKIVPGKGILIQPSEAGAAII